MLIFKYLILIISVVLLSACNSGLLTTLGPDYQTPPANHAEHWQTELPVLETKLAHQGKPEALLQWWQSFQDDNLNTFLQAAESASDNVASALAKIDQARAGLVGADSALVPSIDGNLAATRSSFSFGGPAFYRTQYQVGVQSNWELDLFGGLYRQQQASASQLASRQASWHDARVAVAIEVANAYLNYRYCQIKVQQLEANSVSLSKTAQLTAIAAKQGFLAATDVSLADANATQAASNSLKQQGVCQQQVKGLVALTGLDETTVIQTLNQHGNGQLPQVPKFGFTSLPTEVINQRPDIAIAEQDMAEACAKIGVEEAKRYPRLSLSGNITPTLQSMNSSALALAQTWSIGPTLSLPIFDAGKKAADVEAAKAQYQAAIIHYQSKVRTAIKEVEEALVRLQLVDQRLPKLKQIAENYRRNYRASQQLYQTGLNSFLDLELAKRNLLSAELSVKELEQEQISAWIALYRAAGGSWQEQANQTLSGEKS